MAESKSDNVANNTASNDEKIKKLVLQLLYQNGVIAFDASQSVLDPEVEVQVKGKG